MSDEAIAERALAQLAAKAKRAEIAKVRYTHDACIDMIIAVPQISQNELAAHFGYSAGWMSTIMCSSAFKARLGERRAQLIDPAILNGIEQNMEALAQQAMGTLRNKLDAGVSADVALEVLNVTTRALGYGAKQQGTVVNQQFVVQMPAKEPDGRVWEAQYSPNGGDVRSPLTEER